VIVPFPDEGPIPVPMPLKVFCFDPARVLVSVPSSCPFPQTREDSVIHAGERLFAHHVPMIIGPTSYLGVEFLNQSGGRRSQRGFDCPSDAFQEGLDVVLGRFDEQFPVRVSAHVLSEKIKALFHMRDDCLLGRKLKSSLLQKLLDEGFDCLISLSSSSCDLLVMMKSSA